MYLPCRLHEGVHAHVRFTSFRVSVVIRISRTHPGKECRAQKGEFTVYTSDIPDQFFSSASQYRVNHPSCTTPKLRTEKRLAITLVFFTGLKAEPSLFLLVSLDKGRKYFELEAEVQEKEKGRYSWACSSPMCVP